MQQSAYSIGKPDFGKKKQSCLKVFVLKWRLSNTEILASEIP